jgi:hypothetical protein
MSAGGQVTVTSQGTVADAVANGVGGAVDIVFGGAFIDVEAAAALKRGSSEATMAAADENSGSVDGVDAADAPTTPTPLPTPPRPPGEVREVGAARVTTSRLATLLTSRPSAATTAVRKT